MESYTSTVVNLLHTTKAGNRLDGISDNITIHSLKLYPCSLIHIYQHNSGENTPVGLI